MTVCALRERSLIAVYVKEKHCIEFDLGFCIDKCDVYMGGRFL